MAQAGAQWFARARAATAAIDEAFLLAFISVDAAFLYYLPFRLQVGSFNGIPFAHQNMDRIYGMWDGPLYVTAAATLWDKNASNPLYAWIGQSPSDYSERFPLFPLAVRAISYVLGYWNGALVINIVVSTAVTLLLYHFLKRYSQVPRAAFWIALVAIFWPPRGFFYRYVIMPEPLFILGVLGAVYYYRQSRYLLAGVFGAVAVASRPNGALLVLVFGILAAVEIGRRPRSEWLRQAWKMAGLLCIPATLAGILLWHQFWFGSWRVSETYLSTHGIGAVLQLYPSLMFFGPGDEGVPYLFLLVLAGIFELVRRRQWDVALLSTAFYIPALFTPFDVSRYLLPIIPFAFFLAGDRIVGSKPVRYALVCSIPLVYAYCWATLLYPGYQAPFAPLRALLH